MQQLMEMEELESQTQRSSEKEKKFVNPYDTSPPDPEEKRIHTEVSRADYLFIKLLRPDQGTIKNVIGLLWKQLCYELRQRGITDNTSCAEFERIVANCRIVPNDEYDALRLPDRSAGDDTRRNTKAPRSDDRTRTKRVPAIGANKPEQQPNVPSKRPGQGGETSSESGGSGV
jgi:hypothetical protein